MQSNRYVWQVNQRDKERMFEVAERQFPFSKRTKLLSNALDVDDKTIYRHKESESEGIEIDTAERLTNMLNSSGPRFPLEDHQEFIEDEYTYGGEKMVSVDTEFQNFLLEPFSLSEIAEMSGKTEATARKYRNGKRNMPKELYLDTFFRQKEILENGYAAHGDIVENSPYRSKSEPIFEDAGPEELHSFNQALRDLDSLERSNERTDTRIYKGVLEEPELLEEMVESLEENDPYVDLGDYSREQTYGFREMDIVEPWGGKGSSYHEIVEDDTAYMKALLSEAETEEIKRINS